MNKTLAQFVLLSSASAFAGPQKRMSVLADLKLLQKTGLSIQAKDTGTRVGLAYLSEDEREKLSIAAHNDGHCGGYEFVSNEKLSTDEFAKSIKPLQTQKTHNEVFARNASKRGFATLERRAFIDDTLKSISADNIGETIKWYSSFDTRYERDRQRNMKAVEALKAKLEALAAPAGARVKVEFVDHQNTTQKSLRVHFEGAQRPSEIVVLGGHLDSVNWEESGANRKAPGADDNGSGTACLVEAVRVLALTPATERSVEVFFYAAEETGLVGSAEIAKTYAQQKKNVIGALQLDMTLHPGSGEDSVAFIQDNTSGWLNEYLGQINKTYVGAKVLEESCDYGCSDHASWYHNGYSTVFPFESMMNVMNHELHTPRDVLNSRSSFTHAAIFTRLAVAMALDLGNSTQKEP